MEEMWSVGPPPVRSSHRGAVLVVLALVAGFVGGLAAGYVLDDEPPAGELEAVGAGVDDQGSDASAGTVPATTIPSYVSIEATGPPPRDRLFRRVSAGGFSVRVFSRDYPTPPERTCAPDQWCPPPECFPTRGIEADVVGEWTVTHGSGADSSLLAGETARVLSVIVNFDGQDEPLFGVITRTADGVQSVRLTVDGVTDEMAPIDGVAVLVVPSSAVDREPPAMIPLDARLETVDASGDEHQVPLVIGGMPDPRCAPPPPAPPALPPPGEQPVDVAAEDAAVRARFAYVFGPDSSEKLVEAVDDPTGLDALRDELKARYPDAIGNVEYEVGEVVFTSPDVAAYQFRPVVAGRALPWQIGGARLVDGKWMITRATVCAMYRLGGSSC